MPQEFNADAIGSAALSLSTAILEQLVAKGVLTKDEVLSIFDTLAAAKLSKAELYSHEGEAEASALLNGLRERFATRQASQS